MCLTFNHTHLLDRWQQLIDKRDDLTLTPAEHHELIRLTEDVERFDSERIEGLAELALLRGVPLQELMRQLGLQKTASQRLPHKY